MEPQQEKTLPRYFYFFAYVLYSIEAITIVLSCVLIVGLLIPLLIQLKNGTFNQGSMTRRRRSRQQETPYSTYNIYLVYLALVDLAYFLPMMTAEMLGLNEKYIPGFWSVSIRMYYFSDNIPEPSDPDFVEPIELILNFPYAVANMCINAVIAYEILILLRATQRAQRISQPSLTRVNLQGGGVIFGSMLYGVFNYYNFRFDWIDPFFVALGAIFPFTYVIGVSILVAWRGYMPAGNGSTPGGKAVRGLAFYFLRITLVFIVIWLPIMLISLGLYATGGIEGVASNPPIYVLMYIQPIMTFCFIVTKPDVKKYIKDLVTMTYLFGDHTCCRKKVALVRANENSSEREATLSTNSITILGYNFSGVDAYSDDHDDADVEAEQDANIDPIANGDLVDVAPMVDDDDKDGENSS